MEMQQERIVVLEQQLERNLTQKVEGEIAIQTLLTDKNSELEGLFQTIKVKTE